MPSAEELLVDMERVVGDLTANAQEMVQLSLNECSHKALQPLQARQDEMVRRLAILDGRLQSEYPGAAIDKSSPLVVRIEKALEEFERLNGEFMENVRRHSAVIQFESDKAHRHPKGAGDDSSQPGGSAPTVDPKANH